MFKKFMDAFSAGSTLWGVLPATWQAAVVTGLSGLTGYLAYEGGGLAWAIVLASAVFAFGMAGLFFALRLASIVSVFQRISIMATGISQAAFDKEKSVLSHLNPSLTLKNDSQRLIFYRLYRANITLARQSGDDPKVDRTIQIIQTGGTALVNLHTIGNIPLPEGGGDAPKGKLEMEIEYGPTRDSLPYLFRYVAEIQLGGAFSQAEGKITLALHSIITELEHKKNPHV